VKILIEMGNQWHSLAEIKQQAAKKQVGIGHLFENLLELSRSSFLENDFKKSRTPKLTSFKIAAEYFEEIAQAIEISDE